MTKKKVVRQPSTSKKTTRKKAPFIKEDRGGTRMFAPTPPKPKPKPGDSGNGGKSKKSDS